MLIIHNRNVLKNRVCRRVTARGSGREPLNDEPPEGVVLVALGTVADGLFHPAVYTVYLVLKTLLRLLCSMRTHLNNTNDIGYLL